MSALFVPQAAEAPRQFPGAQGGGAFVAVQGPGSGQGAKGTRSGVIPSKKFARTASCKFELNSSTRPLARKYCMSGGRPVASIPFLRDFEDEFGHGPIFASYRSSQKVAKLPEYAARRLPKLRLILYTSNGFNNLGNLLFARS